MYYWKVPADEQVKDDEGKSKKFGWKELHQEVVASHEVWRSGEGDVLKAYDEVEEKCFDADGGTVIGMTDPTYEIYLPVVTLQGDKINPRSARQFNRLIRPVLTASRAAPKGYQPEQGGDGQKQIAAADAPALPAADS